MAKRAGMYRGEKRRKEEIRRKKQEEKRQRRQQQKLPVAQEGEAAGEKEAGG